MKEVEIIIGNGDNVGSGPLLYKPFENPSTDSRWSVVRVPLIEKNIFPEHCKSPSTLSSSSSCAAWPSIDHKKCRRLLLELKGLNAVIIDTTIKQDEGTKSCIRSNVESEFQLRYHCNKPKCMLKCTCKTASQSRQMNFKTDGQCITPEEALLLHRTTTTTLTQMEKEFTLTVVLTENEIFLINETNVGKKRRCTRTLKRDNYTGNTKQSDAKLLLSQKMNSKKLSRKTMRASKVSISTANTINSINEIDTNSSTTVNVKKADCIEIDMNETEGPIYVKEDILKQIKHCTVNLVRLELYVGFCKGRDASTEPFIKKEISNTAMTHNNINCAVNVLETAQCFQKNDDNRIHNNKVLLKRNIRRPKKSRKSVKKGDHNFDITEIDVNQFDFTDEHNKAKQNKTATNIMNQLKETTNVESKRKINDDANENENDNVENSTQLTKRMNFGNTENDKKGWPRRLVPISRDIYLYRNRSRRPQLIEEIQQNETADKRLLMREHIMRSVYYFR